MCSKEQRRLPPRAHDAVSPSPPPYFRQLRRCGKKIPPPRCEDAMGGLLPMFLWVPPVRQNRIPNRYLIRPSIPPCLRRRCGGQSISPIGDTGSHQGIQDRSLLARGYTTYWRGRRCTLPSGGSAHLHDRQGWQPRSAIHLGGRSISHLWSVRSWCPGSSDLRRLHKGKLCRSQLSNRCCDHDLTLRNPGLSYSDPGPVAEQCLYLLHTNCTRNVNNG